jgi:two-component system, NtrC family, sensor kinase
MNIIFLLKRLRSRLIYNGFSGKKLLMSRGCVLFMLCLFTNVMPVHIIAQDRLIILTDTMLNNFELIRLSNLDGWRYSSTYDSTWADPDYNDAHWESINLKDFSLSHAGSTGKIEAWFRIKITIDSSLVKHHLNFRTGTKSALELYLDGALFKQYGIPHPNRANFKSFLPFFQLGDPVKFEPGEVYTLGVYFVDHYSYLIEKFTNKSVFLNPLILLTTHQNNLLLHDKKNRNIINFWLGPLLLLSGLFWLMYFQNRDERTVLLVAIFTTSMTILCWSVNFGLYNYAGVLTNFFFQVIVVVSSSVAVALVPIIIDKLLTNKISRRYRYLFWFLVVSNCLGFFFLRSNAWLQISYVILVISISIYLSIKRKAYIKTLQWVMLSGMLITIFCIVIYLLLILYFPTFPLIQNFVVTGIYLSMPISMLIYFTIRFKNNLFAARANAARVQQLSNEKEKLIEAQKSELEQQVKSRTEELVKSLDDLKATQTQLIQAEKMASLGELTAGIAHEIQNPLNFVNNFSEVSIELIEELKEELKQVKTQYIASNIESQQTDLSNIEEAESILKDLESNQQKINHHGKRADSIVKGMLQHSRTNTGQKEPTDINAICDEYLRLSYHGLRAKDKAFNASFETSLDPNLPKINVVTQDLGRVLLNLINNAFYAVNEKSKMVAVKTQDVASPPESEYKPTVTVSTKNLGNMIEISVKDNGQGIPDHIKDKIFQPFFTTKPTGQGTGLGLSLSYDIVKVHGGELNVESQVGVGTSFIIKLPKDGE